MCVVAIKLGDYSLVFLRAACITATGAGQASLPGLSKKLVKRTRWYPGIVEAVDDGPPWQEEGLQEGGVKHASERVLASSRTLASELARVLRM